MSIWQRAFLALVLACALTVPGVVLAGGWLVMTLDALPAGDQAAGQEMVVGFVARQHGQNPINDVDAVLTFTHRESGRQMRVNAVQQGPTGHFVARFTPPTAGTWDWAIHAWEANHPMPALTVVPAAVAPVPVPAEPARAPWLLASAGALAVLGVAGLVVAWRRRPLTPRPT